MATRKQERMISKQRKSIADGDGIHILSAILELHGALRAVKEVQSSAPDVSLEMAELCEARTSITKAIKELEAWVMPRIKS
jgi:hypothetical protein